MLFVFMPASGGDTEEEESDENFEEEDEETERASLLLASMVSMTGFLGLEMSAGFEFTLKNVRVLTLVGGLVSFVLCCCI